MKKKITGMLILLLVLITCCNYNISNVLAGKIEGEHYVIDQDYDGPEEDLSKYDIIVAQDGSGKYKTIQEACDAADYGDTIYIKNGTYYEWVVSGNRKDYKAYLADFSDFEKNLNFIGESRDGVILQYNISNYFFAPLFMNEGSIQNMTIYGSSTGDTSSSDEFKEEYVKYVKSRKSEFDEDVYETLLVRLDTDNKAYALHVDSFESFPNNRDFKLKVSNCTIKSDDYTVFGIGLHSNDSIQFTNCIFYTTSTIGEAMIHDDANEALVANYKPATLRLTSVEFVGNTQVYFRHEDSNASTYLYMSNVVFNSGVRYTLATGGEANSFTDVKFNVRQGDYVIHD